MITLTKHTSENKKTPSFEGCFLKTIDFIDTILS